MVEESEHQETSEEIAGTESSERIAELEGLLARREQEIIVLKQTGQELEKKTANLDKSLADAVASYKTVLTQANPEVVEGLIAGDTIESINESLTKAKELVNKVKRGIENEIARTRVPAGAPERKSADLSTLSPREKIQRAIGKK